MFPKDFLSLLLQSPSPDFFISTHPFCDGDGLGAGLALYWALKKRGQNVSFLTFEKPHSKYDFMNKHNSIQIFDKASTPIPKNCILIFVDTNDTRLVETLYNQVKKQNGSVYFIDHHPIIQKNTEDHFFIDTQASSTAELVYTLLKELKTPIDEEIAQNLFSSIVFDTSLFRYIKNSPKPFSISAELVSKIKDVDVIYAHLLKNLTTDNIRFMSQLEKVEYYSNKQIAFLHLKEQDFKKYNTEMNQAYELIDIVKQVKSIVSTALIIEKDNGSYKLSLRSDKKNVLPLAQSFQGGGHTYSAGAQIHNLSLAEIKKTVLAYLQEE